MTTLHAALVTPMTGPLGLYGKTCATALTLWTKKAAHLPATFTTVELAVHDTGDHLHAALQTALEKRPDVLFGPYGSGPMLTVARSCSQLIWNHGGASSRLGRPSFPQVINVLSPTSTYFAGVLHAIHSSDPTARTVSLFHSTTGFGRDVAAGATREASRLQMMLHAIPFEPSHALETIAAVPKSDILLVAGNFADEAAVAPAFVSRNWRFTAYVGAGVEEVLASFSDLREGFLGPAQWVAHTAPLPDEGPAAEWFVTHYCKEKGHDPPYAAAQAFAAGILYAAQTLVCQTLFGAFHLDPLSGLQMGHQMVIVQWQRGQRRVVWPPEQAEGALIFSHPK